MPVVWAEDAADDQYLIRSVLEGAPGSPQVRFASDGHKALDELAKKRPRLVVLDLNMPSMDGIETLRRIRSGPATRDLPVVVFSTAKNPEEVAACMELGVEDFVQKPSDYQQFSQAVLSIVSRAT